MSSMQPLKLASILAKSLVALALLAGTGASAEPILDMATVPLSTTGSTIIKPNMLYVLDDSGSMNWNYMPDWANNGSYSAYKDDPALNTIAYNPAVRYDPPAYFTSDGLIDTNEYSSQTGVSVKTGADGAGSAATPNWHQVRLNAYIKDPAAADEPAGCGWYYDSDDGWVRVCDLVNNASYTVSVPNEFCDDVDLRVCVKASLPTDAYPYPAPLRWCDTAAHAGQVALPTTGECQGVRLEDSYEYPRFPPTTAAPPTYQATITIDDTHRTPGVSGVTVNGKQIMDDPTDTDSSESRLARDTSDEINDCTSIRRGNCDIAGYKASRTRNVVTIVSPDSGDLGITPELTDYNGTVDYTASPFVEIAAQNRVHVDIVSSNNSYLYPGSGVKHPNRTDCANTTCTYVEEMTNYANWFTYYRTRMQMMKTATSIAFKDVGEEFRMGFMTIHPSTKYALDFKEFKKDDKKAWYDKLFKVAPDRGTPLREALSRAGQIYAQKYTLGGVFSDPIQYECQRNFTLLTTDGMWNSDSEWFGFTGGRNVTGGAIPNLDNKASEKGKYEGKDAITGQLADVAKYYRDTDLRNSALGNCINPSGTDVCSTAGAATEKQTMITYTLGLGVDGTKSYHPDYGPNGPGDFTQIYNGNQIWPKATENTPETIDDLWHAAVNGDGRYFSAKVPNDLIEQIREAISLIKIKTGSGAAAATSTLNPVTGDNYAYVASYTTGIWTGNLEKREIDTGSGEVGTAALACVEDVLPNNDCASPGEIKLIDPDGTGPSSEQYFCVTTGVTDPANCTEPLVGTECRVPVDPTCTGELKNQATRTIYMNKSGTLATFDLANFTPAQLFNYDSAQLQANLTQGNLLNTNQQANLTSDHLVSYLKGDKTYELDATLSDNQVFRTRSAVLGDLIDSKPSFIGKPTFSYGDSGYQAYKAANLARAGTVYVGSNDGMLHAFDSDTLAERWAFVPSAVIPNLWKLADSNYSANHAYFVDGDVVISDICVAADCTVATAADWRTILVGGLESGGRGYYALDITNPTTPQLLWEIDPSDTGYANLGYTFGNPIVTKRSGDNRWVVLFTSGYNNIPDNYDTFYGSAQNTSFDPDPNNTNNYFNTGDGGGYLYVVDAATGALLDTIATGQGTVDSPSGLAKITAYADDAEVNNVATYVYGGDLNGNLWRFNITSPAGSVVRLSELKDDQATPLPQPIMTAPELGDISGHRVVFIGTGKYLELTDLDAAGYTTQSLYAIKDTAVGTETATVINNPRANAGFTEQTIAPSALPDETDKRKSTGTTVDFVTGLGWFVDFPDDGERQNVDPSLVLGTLLVPTTVPKSTSACEPAGYGWFNYFDYKTGLAVTPSAGFVSQRTSAPSVGFNVVYVNGKPKISNVVADNPNPELLDNVPFAGSASGFKVQRSIWREIIE